MTSLSHRLRHDIRLNLISLHIILAIIVVVAFVIFATLARRQLQTDIQNNDLALAQAIALEIDSGNQNMGETSQNLLSWMKGVWGNQPAVITVVDANGQNIMQLRGGISLVENSDWSSWSSWQREVIRLTFDAKSGSFVSTSPNNEAWLHSFVTTPLSNSRVIIQRPTKFAFATLNIINRILAVGLIFYLLVGAFFWLRLSREIISPLQLMESFSHRIQTRAMVSAEEQSRLQRLSTRPDQVGNLASALQAMGARYQLTDSQLQEKSHQLQATVESLDVGLILESPDGTVLYSNRQAAEWVARPAEALVGRSATNLLQELVPAAPEGQQVRQALENAPNQMLEIERADPGFRLNGKAHKMGSPKQDLNLHLFSVTNGQGEVIGRGQIWQDVTRYKEVDRMKSALLSTISHELRTPLTSIIGYSDTLMATDIQWEEAKRKKFLWRIHSEAKRLKRLIEDLLDMTKLESGRLSLSAAPSHMHDLLKSTLNGLGAAHSDQIILDLATDLPLIEIDSTRISTVMRNYIENGLKYGPPDKPITISTDCDADFISFVVHDQGRPLPAEIRGKLFEPFFRADNGLTRNVGGVGLGLSICKGFIEAHQGKVWVSSGGDGNRFGFKLPVSINTEH